MLEGTLVGHFHWEVANLPIGKFSKCESLEWLETLHEENQAGKDKLNENAEPLRI